MVERLAGFGNGAQTVYQPPQVENISDKEADGEVDVCLRLNLIILQWFSMSTAWLALAFALRFCWLRSVVLFRILGDQLLKFCFLFRGLKYISVSALLN